MEEILVIILQVFFEFFLEFLIYAGLDLAAFGWKQGKDVGGGWIAAFCVAGAVIGGLTNLVHPRAFLPSQELRFINLVVGPFAAGAIAWAWTEWRRERGKPLEPRNHFHFAFWF